MKIKLRSISVKIIAPVFIVLSIFAVILCGLVSDYVRRNWLANSEATITCDSQIATDLMNRELELTDSIANQVVNLYISLYVASGNGVVSDAFMQQLCDPVIKSHKMSTVGVFDTNMNLISP